jgi:hypothetical protein
MNKKYGSMLIKDELNSTTSASSKFFMNRTCNYSRGIKNMPKRNQLHTSHIDIIFHLQSLL